MLPWQNVDIQGMHFGPKFWVLPRYLLCFFHELRQGEHWHKQDMGGQRSSTAALPIPCSMHAGWMLSEAMGALASPGLRVVCKGSQQEQKYHGQETALKKGIDV
eukprot:1159810-Pelagomonas_calceolata.AAC.10